MIFLVFGTRPEIIKFSPIVRELVRRKATFKIVHSNQHYSPDMDAVFFRELKLPKPDFNLDAGSGTQANQLARIMTGLEPILEKERPDIVVVQGDTNTTFAAALVASRLGILVAHVEAGLRSLDRRMPEEANRILTDQLSFWHFCPTRESAENLKKENIGAEKLLTPDGLKVQHVLLPGNTAVDATIQNQDLAHHDVLKAHGLSRKGYVLVTAHRAENVDHAVFLENLIGALSELKKTIVWPLHPRTRKNLEKFGLLEKAEKFTLLPPQGYLDFLALEANAALCVTDSGGVQEEACTLGVPCVTVRKTTDRPETISVGANELGGTQKAHILSACIKMLERKARWDNPFGDGHSAERIVDELLKHQKKQ